MFGIGFLGNELNGTVKVRLIAHSKNGNDTFYDKLDDIEDGKHVATFYSGEIQEKNYAVALLGLSFLKNFNVKLNFKEGMLEIE